MSAGVTARSPELLHIVKSAQGRRGKSPLGLSCPDTMQHFELFLKVPEEGGSLQLAWWFVKRTLKTAGWGDFHGGGGDFHFLVKDFFVVAGNADKVKSQDNGSLTQTQSCTQLLPFPPQFLFNFNPGLKLYRTA